MVIGLALNVCVSNTEYSLQNVRNEVTQIYRYTLRNTFSSCEIVEVSRPVSVLGSLLPQYISGFTHSVLLLN